MKTLVDHPAFNIAIFALLLSLPWECGQTWLYAGTSEMSYLKGIQVCMVGLIPILLEIRRVLRGPIHLYCDP